MRTLAFFAFLSLAAYSIADPFDADLGWDAAPVIALAAQDGAYPNGEPATVFSVVEAEPPVHWRDLDLFCPGGTGPASWGGDLSAAGDRVGPGDRLFCDGSGLSIVHLPTDTLVYDQPT